MAVRCPVCVISASYLVGEVALLGEDGDGTALDRLEDTVLLHAPALLYVPQYGGLGVREAPLGCWLAVTHVCVVVVVVVVVVGAQLTAAKHIAA